MKKMMEITKLVSKNSNEELYVFIALEDFKKYVFVKKNNMFIPYYDKKLLEILNNFDKVMYNQSVEEEKEESKKKKQKLTLKEKLQKTLAGLGVAVTIVTCVPSATELISYSMKRNKTSTISTTFELDEGNDRFVSEANQAFNNNPYFTDEEKEIVTTGFKKYIDDWGYLLNETDKKYLIYMCENLKFHRDVWQPYWSLGSYSCKNIWVKNNKDSNSVVSHEVCHAFSDRGLLNGTISGYAFGYALNEGINTSVNDYYYMKDDTYEKFRMHVFNLSLLVDNEVLIKAYQKNGPEYIVSSVIEQNPNISAADVIRYILKMDLELFFADYKVLPEFEVPIDFRKEMQELYNKMFKIKYGYDYSESVMSEQTFDGINFLDEKLELTRTDGFVVKKYLIPKSLLSSKSSEFDYEKYLIEENKEFDYSGSLSILASQSEVENYTSWDEFCMAFASKYPSPEEELAKVKAVFTQKLCEGNFDHYMKYTLDKVLMMEQSPEFTACYIKKIRDIVKSEAGESIENFEERFTTKTKEFLMQNNMEEVLNLYINSDIEFETFDYDDINNCILPEEYEMVHLTEDYMIMDDGLLVLRVSEGDTFWTAKYGEETLYLRETSEEASEQYNEIFGSSEGKYYYTYTGLDATEKEKISIFVSSTCKTQGFQNSASAK